jgi:enoyl-CoA hydratase/carnithine racemase/3-hydroxyacyl-CoA dehydrogenase
MRPSTLQTLGLGSAIDIVSGGSGVTLSSLVDQVFGPANDRGALVISGANGIVGAGKMMQLGSRLEPFGVPVVALDFPGVPDGIGKQYPGLVRAFGKDQAAKIMSNTVQLSYDGKNLPKQLAGMKPRFLLEAIPEILEIKKAHYETFRTAFPEIEIRSVTSGFPQSALGVGIAHPAFPHEINKIFEIVEPEPSAVTQLLWAMGLIPMQVSDDWSFVLDVLFCGLTLAAIRYHEATNMPVWKVDKFVRKLLGPNPLRAHDAIGAAGANFLTWSCLHHLSEHYGDLFTPAATLEAKRDSGENWYPLNHFRPLVDWSLEGDEVDEFNARILGPILQMTSLMVHEKRSHLTQMNAIGELCAQFTRGVLAVARSHGADAAIKIVEAYHKLHPEAAAKAWFPDAFAGIDSPAWQQLYVNAEHDGTVGVLTISRESYSSDVDAELNRAIDWLKAAGIERVILTGDFHLSTQMVGADTSEFYPALEDESKGYEIARNWSATARRLHDDFAVSVGLVNGKRCLGGMLELMLHCRYLVAVDSASLGMPEVTLPVVPGMEGCHWPFRKAPVERWPELLRLLLEGRPVKATEAVGWLIDFTGPLDQALQAAWKIASGGDHGLSERAVNDGKLSGIDDRLPELSPVGGGIETGRKAILDSIRASCGVTLAEANQVQARHSGGFMPSKACLRGVIGTMFTKTMKI